MSRYRYRYVFIILVLSVYIPTYTQITLLKRIYYLFLPIVAILYDTYLFNVHINNNSDHYQFFIYDLLLMKSLGTYKLKLYQIKK